MKPFSLVTVWAIDAPIEQVWEAVYRLHRWPGWWNGALEVVELEKGDALGVGSLQRFTWKGRLPYTLTFVCRVIRVEPMAVLEGIACGELEGIGRWNFASQDSVTTVCYEWRVCVTKPWMRLLSPVAYHLFRWNHDALMREGALGLSRLLNARLVACTNSWR